MAAFRRRIAGHYGGRDSSRACSLSLPEVSATAGGVTVKFCSGDGIRSAASGWATGAEGKAAQRRRARQLWL